MNKILAFLEKHVQWIALGLGGLYLGYMIFTYAVQTPVLEPGIASTPLTPGEVDPQILESAATPLEAAMKDTNVPEMTVPNFIDQFKADMDFSNLAPTQLALIPDSPVLPFSGPGTSARVVVPDRPINALPALPQAVFVDYSTGKSNVQPLVPPAGGANPPPPAPAGNGVQLVAGSSDKCWVTVSYKISPSDLAKAFKAVNIPGWTEHTTILQVQLWREEALPGGKWSDPKLTTPINSQSLLTYPATNSTDQELAYLTWATGHVSDILQPAFYQVNKGDPWHAPGQIIPVAAPAAVAPLDPSQNYPNSVLSQYSAEERLAYWQAKAKLKASQPRPGGRSAPAAPQLPPGARNNSSPDAIGSEIFADVMPANPDAPAAASPAAPADLAAQFPIPQGDFDPNLVTADITGWAHDDTAEPGHTYRYMISYRIKNPIFGTNAAKNNPKLAAVFDLQSPPGSWSKPINVASTTNFFVYANSRPGAPSARFKVYRWQNGVERSHVFEVAPGDIIGGKDGDVDYNTGWTVVDLRFDDPHNPDSMTVLVMDPSGVLDRRDYNTDQTKDERKALDKQVSNAASADQLAGKP